MLRNPALLYFIAFNSLFLLDAVKFTTSGQYSTVFDWFRMVDFQIRERTTPALHSQPEASPTPLGLFTCQIRQNRSCLQGCYKLVQGTFRPSEWQGGTFVSRAWVGLIGVPSDQGPPYSPLLKHGVLLTRPIKLPVWHSEQPGTVWLCV